MISFAPQIAQIFTDYYISSIPIVIQRSIATKDLNTSTNAFQILHYTSFRSE